MRKIPCELTLGNGGDVIVMVQLGDDGTLHIPKQAKYGSFLEGVLKCRPLAEEDEQHILHRKWVDI